MMKYRVDHKLTATILALFFLFISKGALATKEEGGAVAATKPGVRSVVKKGKGSESSKPSRWSLLKKKVVGSSSDIRTMVQFDKSGDIDAFKGVVNKLKKYIKDDFGKAANTRTQKRDELDVFKAVLKVSSKVGSDKFDTKKHYDAALELVNVALDNKAKFKNNKFVVKIAKLPERLKAEREDPSKRELRFKKSADQKARSFVNKLKKGTKDKKALKSKKSKRSKGSSRRARRSRAPKQPLTPEEKKLLEREKAIAKELSALKKEAKKAKGEKKSEIAKKQKELKAELKTSQATRKKVKKEALAKSRSAKKDEKKKVKEEKKVLKEEKTKLKEEEKKAVTPEEKAKVEQAKKDLEEKSKELKEEKKRSREERRRSKKERSKKG